MENNIPYIKLSRIRTDYGIGNRQGTNLGLNELDGFSTDQLIQLKSVLRDECDDIEYQINLEKKKCEKDSRWMYGSKNSLKAREQFIERIEEILCDNIESSSSFAERFLEESKKVLDTNTFNRIKNSVLKPNDLDIFSVNDM